jgi:hypothetical protein
VQLWLRADGWLMLRALADQDVPWKGLHLLQVDERVTPAESEERNFRHIRESLLDQGRASALAGSHLLVATGRVSNTDTLNLALAGLQTDDRGFIKVNNRLETSDVGYLRAASTPDFGPVRGIPPCIHHVCHFL